MLTIAHPVHDQIREFLDSLRRAELTYSPVGLTRLGPDERPPRGFDVDRHRVLLGFGADAFVAAKEAIRQWRMFPPQMATLCWPSADQEVGSVVAVIFRAGLWWSVNPCRVVYRVEETGEVDRWGFAYGTLPGHLERGEELFCVTHDHRDDRVWYELTAVSRPAHWLTRLGYPYARCEQARFRRLSGEAMQSAVRFQLADAASEAMLSVRRRSQAGSVRHPEVAR